jgi:hypothetical protein
VSEWSLTDWLRASQRRSADGRRGALGLGLAAAALSLALIFGAHSGSAESQPAEADSATAAGQQKPRYCRSVNTPRVRIIRLERALGCRKIRRRARRTVNSRHGYLQSRTHYCRWSGGSAGFPTITIKGKKYTRGFCYAKRTRREANFLARRKKR